MHRRQSYLGLLIISLLIIFTGDDAVSGLILGGDTFYDTNQSLGNSLSQVVVTADLDGDGDLDLFVGNNGSNRVYFNNGYGQFTDSGQNLGNNNTEGAALADLDGDDDVDAVAANSNGFNRVWLNNGSGIFTDSGQMITSNTSRGVALGYLDSDNDIDIFIANNGPNTVWFNNGNANFTNSGQTLGNLASYDVELGHLNNDNYLDAFVANGSASQHPDGVWLNDGTGTGTFYSNGQTLDSVWSYDVALGDLNGDTYLDAFSASWFPNGNRVWLNNGNGIFTNNGQSLGSAASLGVDLGDVDGDNDLDAVIGNNTPGPNQLWINNGVGLFIASQTIDSGTTTYSVALDDFDGDLDPDLFLANFGANQVWINGIPGTPDAYFAVDRETNDLGQDVTYWGQSGSALVPVMLSQTAPQNMNAFVQVESPGEVMTVTVPFGVGSQVQILNVVNPQPTPNIEYTLSLFVPPLAMLGGTNEATDRLTYVWVDADQGPTDCILCYLDWILRFLNFQPTFYELHHFELTEQEASPQWDYYTRLFDGYSPTLSGLVAENPSLAWMSEETLQQWTPAVESLSNGTGDSFIVTAEMVNSANDLFDELKETADPDLAAIIQREQALIDVESMAGMSMDEAWDAFQLRRPVEELFITIILKA